MALTIKEIQTAIENGYIFNIVEQPDKTAYIVGSQNTDPMPTNAQDIQGLSNISLDFLVWAVGQHEQYEGREKEFYDEFKERLEFVMVSIGGLVNPEYKG